MVEMAYTLGLVAVGFLVFQYTLMSMVMAKWKMEKKFAPRRQRIYKKKKNKGEDRCKTLA
jgi:hypothetical protein|nr:MAG TPA: hypothetical protein [Caudoviricetes sp.]